MERVVQRWVNNRAEGDEYDAKGVLGDLMQGGCQSGFVGDLIYYHDTLKFFQSHRREISELLKNIMSDCGSKSPADLFGDKWEDDDPLAQETQNRNLLAWFGFEETARILAERNGIEL